MALPCPRPAFLDAGPRRRVEWRQPADV